MKERERNRNADRRLCQPQEYMVFEALSLPFQWCPIVGVVLDDVTSCTQGYTRNNKYETIISISKHYNKEIKTPQVTDAPRGMEYNGTEIKLSDRTGNSISKKVAPSTNTFFNLQNYKY